MKRKLQHVFCEICVAAEEISWSQKMLTASLGLSSDCLQVGSMRLLAWMLSLVMLERGKLGTEELARELLQKLHLEMRQFYLVQDEES